MKSRKKLILILIIILLTIGTISLAYTFFFTPEIEEFDMYLTVGDYVGFNVDASALYFGTTPRGGSASRRLILENDADLPKEVKISASGELAEWVWTKENNFVLNKNETREIKVHVSPPRDAEFGNYTGKLRIEFRKIYISPWLF